MVDALGRDVRREGLDPEAQREALDKLERLRAGLNEAPQLVERARRLIRYAGRMTESKLCRGKEQREAVEAVQRAVQAYEEAREAIAAGKPMDGVRTLRRIGERVALSAAKAARSCASGQTSLTVAEKPARAPRGKATGAATAPRAARRPSVPAAEVAAVDEAKDKALLDVFSTAIAAALAPIKGWGAYSP